MKNIYIALITPFLENGEIDYDGLDILISSLINEGCHGFIICGTTAEASTLKEEEKFSILKFVLDRCLGKVEIYFGCGTNDTMETLRLCRKAQNYPIDGVLLVTPYYNNPTQEGLYLHFSTIANNCSLPIILYQVENRCNCVFAIDTLKKLTQKCPTIIGLKYASSDLEKLKCIKEDIPTLLIYCGMDAYIKEFNDVNADGVISVIGHFMMKQIINLYDGDDSVDLIIKEICSILFKESNPIGIKYVLSKIYSIHNILRLPMTSLSSIYEEEMNTILDKL